MNQVSMNLDEKKEWRILCLFSLISNQNRHFLPLWGLPKWHSLPMQETDIRDMRSVSRLGRSPGEGHATHSSLLAWKIPLTEEPGGLQPVELQRVGHYWRDLALRKRQTRVVFSIYSIPKEIRGIFMPHVSGCRHLKLSLTLIAALKYSYY